MQDGRFEGRHAQNRASVLRGLEESFPLQRKLRRYILTQKTVSPVEMTKQEMLFGD